MIVISQPLFAQVSIISANIQTFNITPQTLCQVTLMNESQSQQVWLVSEITTNSNEPLITVSTNPFTINSGINQVSAMSFSIKEVSYGNSNLANYLRTLHILPSGEYIFCCNVIQNEVEGGDEYCEEIESDITSFLNLVTPFDEDSIEAGDPMLVWSHTEPFDILITGEYFRIIVAEMDEGQTAEAAVMNNVPVYYKDFVATHQVQYPSDAQDLEKGKTYGWQVQKINNGNITARTEAWAFTIIPDKIEHNNKYAVLKRELDGTYYTAMNNKIFFVFDEEYNSEALKYCIYNHRQEKMFAGINSDDPNNPDGISIKKCGFNRYELDLSGTSIASGYYLLEVYNEKNEKFLMKFYVQ